VRVTAEGAPWQRNGERGDANRSGESSILDEAADVEVHGAALVLLEGDGLPGLQDPLEECPVLF